MGDQWGHGANDGLTRLYLTEIAKHPLLSIDEERQLGETIERGRTALGWLQAATNLSPDRRAELEALVAEGQEAVGRFVHANLRLVVSVARRYQHLGLPLLDLIQEGNLGLLHAVAKCDFTKGFKFSTYAIWWIRHAITRAHDNTGRAIRLPVSTKATLAQVRKTRAVLEAKHCRPPTTAEVAKALGMDAGELAELLAAVEETEAIAVPGGGGDQAPFEAEDVESPSPFEAAVTALIVEGLQPLLSLLSGRQREILCMRYGLDGNVPLTFEEIAERFGVTKERVRQIEADALRRLRSTRAATKALDLISG